MEMRSMSRRDDVVQRPSCEQRGWKREGEEGADRASGRPVRAGSTVLQPRACPFGLPGIHLACFRILLRSEDAGPMSIVGRQDRVCIGSDFVGRPCGAPGSPTSRGTGSDRRSRARRSARRGARPARKSSNESPRRESCRRATPSDSCGPSRAAGGRSTQHVVRIGTYITRIDKSPMPRVMAKEGTASAPGGGGGGRDSYGKDA